MHVKTNSLSYNFNGIRIAWSFLEQHSYWRGNAFQGCDRPIGERYPHNCFFKFPNCSLRLQCNLHVNESFFAERSFIKSAVYVH